MKGRIDSSETGIAVSNPDKDQGHIEGLRDVLIAEAMRILETDGLEALSLRAVARAAKVSHAAPYRHFADKDALLAAVSARGFLALAAAMEAAAAGIDDPFRRRSRIGIAYVRYALDHPARYRLMFGPTIAGKRRFPELVEAGERSFRRCRQMMADVAGPAERADEALIERRAIAIWSLVHGLASLLIDDTVTLPGPDDLAIDERISAVLKIAP